MGLLRIPNFANRFIKAFASPCSEIQEFSPRAFLPHAWVFCPLLKGLVRHMAGLQAPARPPRLRAWQEVKTHSQTQAHSCPLWQCTGGREPGSWCLLPCLAPARSLREWLRCCYNPGKAGIRSARQRKCRCLLSASTLRAQRGSCNFLLAATRSFGEAAASLLYKQAGSRAASELQAP